ncbi:S-adenosylmethionine:tRNA ribosyltransferase-isomerase [Cytophaga aurantiaca]|uniref:S-adenosylmethionine:tRNA ribosyltransferase-isomerase n=1 Tax=Cytophaga aurantiaca TaxID=29530 RepID=UPI000475E194|nr:S-adenosylmethionine:tRNA ribosyltransferase-isomerase [Cytophaga aurantiaca]
MKIDTDNIETYNYDLPLERIAEYPLAIRDQSNLLVYKNEKIVDDLFTSITDHLPSNSLLVFNNTRVVQARFLFQTSTGAAVEIFSLEPNEGGPAESMSAKGPVVWKCFVGNAKRWKQPVLERNVMLPSGDALIFHAKQLDKKDDYYIIEFSWNLTHITFSEIFSLLGDLPLPPYMKRKTEENDKLRYQTIYAKHEGSVAAPTAGLHFTEQVFESLKSKGIECREVTLHVGAGTFKPVKTDSLKDHSMHSEYITVSKEIIECLCADDNNKFIVPVGTTSMRTLESLYWLGCKLTNDLSEGSDVLPELQQWDAYSLNPLPLKDSMENLLAFISKRNANVFSARTSLLIKPGYEFKVCKALITNFHQPKSTLLCLVASFIGVDPMKKIYDSALANNYRFLSYGDSSLLFGKMTVK